MSKSKNKKLFQTREILWNIINAGLCGALVLLGALTKGGISAESFCIALVTALIVAITQFKEYWASEEKEYRSKKCYGFMKLL